MIETAQDAVSRLICLQVEPRTLAKMLRVDRDDVAHWALALRPVPDTLAPPIVRLQTFVEEGLDVDIDDLAWELRRMPDDAWRRALEDWHATARTLQRAGVIRRA